MMTLCVMFSPLTITMNRLHEATTFTEVEDINWGMIENCIFSVLFHVLCTLLGLIKGHQRKVCAVWATTNHMFLRGLKMAAKKDDG